MSQPEQRHVLRPEHFSVAPHLLGLPLAHPARRFFALLIDLMLVALLANLGGSFALAIAASFAFFRFAARSRVVGRASGRPWVKRMWLLRAAGAFMLFLVVRGGVERAKSVGTKLAGLAPGMAAQQVAPQRSARPPRDSALLNADDRVAALRVAERLVATMRAAGASDEDIREALEEASEGSEQPWMGEVVGTALVPAPPEEEHPVPPDSLAVWHAAALARHDTAALDSLRPRLASALARDSLDELRGSVAELQEDARQQRARADRAENRGVLASILQTFDELGIGFGWTGLYFTALTALWRGQTPGKRLLGIRVIRLNGEPMTTWVSFERFGGYAAGLFTGLLGFAQVFWDRNRQAIHDKITETVVVRDERAPEPAPAPLEPAARPRYRAPT